MQRPISEACHGQRTEEQTERQGSNRMEARPRVPPERWNKEGRDILGALQIPKPTASLPLRTSVREESAPCA